MPLLREAPTQSLIVAMQASNLGTLSALDGSYRGLVLATSSGTNEVFPVAITLNNGSGTGNEINADTGVLSVDSIAVALTSVDSPSNGLINGTIDGSTLRCMTNTDINSSGKNFIFCIGENPGEAGKLYNLLLVSS